MYPPPAYMCDGLLNAVCSVHSKQVGMKRNKLNTLVNFPVTGLNMAPHVVKRTINNNTRYCDESPSGKTSNGPGSPIKHMALLGGSTAEMYDLFAVCNHYGDMCGGHYTGESREMTPVT